MHLVLFHNDKEVYGKSLRRLVDSAVEYGVHSVHIYTPARLLPLLSEGEWDFIATYRNRGYGHYAWKPCVIDIVRDMVSGPILYHDVGPGDTYSYEFKKQIRVPKPELIVNVAETCFPHSEWTSQQCEDQMNVRVPAGHKQVSAAWGFFMHTSRAFVKLWRWYCFTPANHAEDPHRWDQAILTNLLYKFKIPSIGGGNFRNINEYM